MKKLPHWFDAALIAVFILITAGALGAVGYRDALANLHDYTTKTRRP